MKEFLNFATVIALIVLAYTQAQIADKTDQKFIMIADRINNKTPTTNIWDRILALRQYEIEEQLLTKESENAKF